LSVAFNTTNATSASGALGVTISITPTGANKAVLLGIAYEGQLGQTGLDGAPVPSSGTAIALANNPGGTGVVQSELWSVMGFASGALMIDVAVLDLSDLIVFACSYTGVDQVTPFGVGAIVNGAGTGSSATILATPNGSMVFDTVTAEGGASFVTLTPHGGQVSRQNQGIGSSGFRYQYAASDELGGGDAHAAWTLSLSKSWGTTAVSILPSVSAGQAAMRVGLAAIKRLMRMTYGS